MRGDLHGISSSSWNHDFQNSFPVLSSYEPQELFGVIAERWKEAVAISFYGAKAGAGCRVWLQLGCMVSALGLPLRGPQPACSNSSGHQLSLFSFLHTSPAVWEAPVATVAFALPIHTGLPPVSLTLGLTSGVGFHGEGHQPHTQVTGSVDVEAWQWKETYMGSSFFRGHKFVLPLSIFQSLHQLTSPVASPADLRLSIQCRRTAYINCLTSSCKCIRSKPYN